MARKSKSRNEEKFSKTNEGNQAYPEYSNRETKGNNSKK
jgi:hypothetical protein